MNVLNARRNEPPPEVWLAHDSPRGRSVCQCVMARKALPHRIRYRKGIRNVLASCGMIGCIAICRYGNVRPSGDKHEIVFANNNATPLGHVSSAFG